jgi:antitoxin component of RelBE/YafQ-DinJ toxin-antitoxin module
MARDSRLSIMVDERVKIRIGEMADSMGLTTSALCAFVLGQYVAQQETLIRPMLDKLGHQMAEIAMAANSIDQGEKKPGDS